MFFQLFGIDTDIVIGERDRAMDTSSTDPVLRECRRYELATKLMVLRARTQTVTVLTNLSRHQLAYLRQRCRIPEATRHRGPLPTSLNRFTRSSPARSEGAVLAAFCRAYHVIPEKMSLLALSRNGQILEFGEHLCAAYEAYRACFPLSRLDLDELLLLLHGFARNREIGLGRCPSCGSAVLIDRLSRRRRACGHCRGPLVGRKDSVGKDDRDPPRRAPRKAAVVGHQVAGGGYNRTREQEAAHGSRPLRRASIGRVSEDLPPSKGTSGDGS